MDWLTTQDGWIWSATRLWRTTNGGSTWTALGAWPGTQWHNLFALGYPLGWVHMVSKTEGWAATDPFELGDAWQTLWRTTTGGRTWERVPVPQLHYEQPNFIGHLVGFYIAAERSSQELTLWMGPETPADGGATPQRIWTNDWGIHWHRARVNAVEPTKQKPS